MLLNLASTAFLSLSLAESDALSLSTFARSLSFAFVFSEGRLILFFFVFPDQLEDFFSVVLTFAVRFHYLNLVLLRERQCSLEFSRFRSQVLHLKFYSISF